MTVIAAKQALLAGGWARDVTLRIDAGGCLQPATGPAEHHVDVLLPAPANLHSHAFQRAMAGLTERRGPSEGDSFWTWRALMFRFLAQLTPEDVEAIAAQVQMEMLEAGYGAVGEFHYLNHQPDGRPYADLGEMGMRIAAAAQETGIGLTLLPVLYQTGGMDGRALAPGQARFGSDRDLFARMMARFDAVVGALPRDARLGVAPRPIGPLRPPATT